MLKLIRYLKKYRKEVIIGPIFKLIEAIFELIVPLVMARIIDVGVKNADKTYIFKMGGVMILLGIVGLCCALVCQFLAAKASQGVGTDLRNDVFGKINSFSYSQVDKFGTSSLINRIISDVNQLQLAVAMLIRLIVRAPFLIIGATVMAFTIDAKLAVIFAIIIPLVAFMLYYVMSRSVPYYKSMQTKLDRISGITKENLNGVRVVRAFSKQKHEEERFDDATDDLTKAGIRVGKISALLNPMCYVILNGGIIALLWYGGLRVGEGNVTQGEIIALVNYMTQILLALVVVANLVVIFTKAEASAMRVNEVLDTVPEISEGKFTDGNENAPKIEFRNVSFSYNKNGEYDIENVSLSIEKGQTVGVIGSTGSGKSTLINLIPRFYDVDAGEVLVDGVNVRKYLFTALRKKIGIVPQKTSLFSGTVADNLRIGDSEADENRLKKAIHTAQADDILARMPDGYNTIISEGGKNLSGGQRQRLTIARALVSNPEILLLDDSSSALDYVTDANLRKALREDTTDMTVIIVSQRASAVKFADKIVVLDDGKVVGIGTHIELMNSCEVYKEICASQEVLQ